MTTTMKIAFTVDVQDVGSILALLAGRVSNLEFHAVEERGYQHNKPGNGAQLAPSRAKQKKRGRQGQHTYSVHGSRIPEVFKGKIDKDKIYGYGDIRDVMVANGYSPLGYSNALLRLLQAGLLAKTEERGKYVGLMDHR